MGDDTARRYWRVSPRFWASTEGWSDDARLLGLYLLTCPHRTTEGLFRLPKAYMAADLGWTTKRLAEPLAELLSNGFVQYDEDASVVLIMKALSYQSPENPNQVKAAIQKLGELPDTPLTSTFKGLAERFSERLAEALPEGFGEPLALSQALSLAPTLPPSEPLASDEVENLCAYLADCIEANGSKRPTVTKGWRDSCRLMLDRDGRTAEQVHNAITWCQQDEFWRSNVLSMGKLREKFDTLRLAAKRTNGSNGAQQRVANNTAVLTNFVNGGAQ